MLKLIQPISKKDQVIAAIELAILSGATGPGIKLSRVAWRTSLAVAFRWCAKRWSRSNVWGLCRTPYKGTTITELEPKQIQDNFELRVELEPLAVAWAKQNVTPADISELRGLIRESKKQRPSSTWMAFIRTIWSGTESFGQYQGIVIWHTCWSVWSSPLFAFFVMKTSREKQAYIESAEMHARIVEALASGSAKEVRELMRESVRLERRYDDFTIRETIVSVPRAVATGSSSYLV